MRVLVTGATGLVGKKLLSQLQAHNIEVAFLTTAKDKLDALPYCKGFFGIHEKEK